MRNGFAVGVDIDDHDVIFDGDGGGSAVEV